METSPPPPPYVLLPSDWSVPPPCPVPKVQFAEALYAGEESDGRIVVTVRRGGDVSHQSTVRCYTRQGSAQVGGDFIERPNTDASLITFLPGNTHTQPNTHTHTHKPTHTHTTHIHTHTPLTYTHARTNSCTQTHQTHIHTPHIHTNIYTHIYTHTAATVPEIGRAHV